MLFKRLPWLDIKTYVSKLSNIEIYFYINIVCKIVFYVSREP